jgi:hypothetical protein
VKSWRQCLEEEEECPSVDQSQRQSQSQSQSQRQAVFRGKVRDSGSVLKLAIPGEHGGQAEGSTTVGWPQ